MSNITFVNQIEMLRTQLETSLPIPGVLVVSSARSDDGKGLVASGLASSMHAAGYSTLLVLADEQERGAEDALGPKSIGQLTDSGIARYVVRSPRTTADAIYLSNDKLERSVSRESVVRLTGTCRATYQVTVVESRHLLTNAFAMLMSVASDGVLVTIREGRRVCSEDRKLAQVLEREQAPFLGVVSVESSLIRNDRLTRTPKQTPAASPMRTANLEAGRKRQAV